MQLDTDPHKMNAESTALLKPLTWYLIKTARTFGSPHLVLPVLDGGDPEGGLVGEHETARGQPLVPRIQHSVQHGLVEQAVAHPLRDDDVHLGTAEDSSVSKPKDKIICEFIR